MFVLDTNVVSELRKAKSGKADRNVTAWASTAIPGSLFISAISVLELETGVRLIERVPMPLLPGGPTVTVVGQESMPVDRWREAP